MLRRDPTKTEKAPNLVLRKSFASALFYQRFFQTLGVAETQLERDVCRTGLQAAMLPDEARLGWQVACWSERTVSDRPTGTAFRYENSNGLTEVGFSQGRTDHTLGRAIGTPVEIRG